VGDPSEPLLVIGNRTYSSWSLRPWLLMKALGIPFREKRIALYQAATSRELAKLSPSGKVPVLIDGERVVWDSLAILEYVAERVSRGEAWPVKPEARATARAVSAEMHAGFPALREECPMNCRVRYPGYLVSDAVKAEVDRITDLWRSCRERHGEGGPWLFGRMSIADAMYAPVATRFVTYDVPLDGPERAYVRTVLTHPAMQEWLKAARWEPETLAQCEKRGLPTEPFQVP
jgi:glutathione S-transferase